MISFHVQRITSENRKSIKGALGRGPNKYKWPKHEEG